MGTPKSGVESRFLSFLSFLCFFSFFTFPSRNLVNLLPFLWRSSDDEEDDDEEDESLELKKIIFHYNLKYVELYGSNDLLP